MSPHIAFRVSGFGAALPTHILTNDDLAESLDTEDAWIRSRTGIRSRRVVRQGEDVLGLALGASQEALAEAGLQPSDLDLVVVATCTPHTQIPSTACWLQHTLGCRPVPAFDLNAACSGFVYALVAAASMMQGAGLRHVLVVGAEAMSTVTDYEDRSSCILFGDAGGAVILSAEEDADGPRGAGLYHHHLGADGSGAELIWIPAGGSRKPASTATVANREHYLHMEGRRVFRWAVPRMVDLITGTLAEYGIAPEELALIVPHQSNRRILEAAAERLGIARRKLAINIEHLGNTAAASVPVAWRQAHQEDRFAAGDWVLLVGLGAGLTWGTALLRI